jgi:two-component system chemotaxis response regulator CheY
MLAEKIGVPYNISCWRTDLPIRSLVVDDSPIMRVLLVRLLSEYGDCDQAKDGDEAVLKFARGAEENRPYDLICLDLNLPQTDGLRVLRSIREKEQLQQAPRAKVLNISAENDSGVVRHAVQLGADGYLVKPVTIEALADRVAVLFPEAARNAEF